MAYLYHAMSHALSQSMARAKHGSIQESNLACKSVLAGCDRSMEFKSWLCVQLNGKKLHCMLLSAGHARPQDYLGSTLACVPCIADEPHAGEPRRQG